MTDKEIKKYFSSLGMRLFLGSLIMIAVQVAMLLTGEGIFPRLLDNENTYLLLTTLSMYLIAFPLMALLLRKLPAVSIQKHSMKAGELVSAFCISYALGQLSNLAGLILTYGIGQLKGAPVENPLTELTFGLNPGTAFLVMVLMAPVAEEYLFRKLIMDRLAVFGEGTAILFSGLFFGLFHGNLNQFAYAFTLGMFLGFIYIKTGRLVYSIIIHMGVNFMGTLVMMLFDTSLVLSAVYVLAVLVLFVYGMVRGIRSRRLFRRNPGEVTIPRGRGFSITILNTGMILYILFWGIQIGLQLILS